MRKTISQFCTYGLVIAVGLLLFTGSGVDEQERNVGVPTLEAGQSVEASASWTPIPFPLPPTTCGGNVCGWGEYCCNPSCGTCTPFGAYCTQQVCAPTE